MAVLQFFINAHVASYVRVGIGRQMIYIFYYLLHSQTLVASYVNENYAYELYNYNFMLK